MTVTFLRMDRPPPTPAAPCRPTPAWCGSPQPSVAFYRYLYDTVGAPHLWWLRRALPDSALAGMLADPAVSIHVLYRGGEPAGFFELDGRSRRT